MISPLYSCFSSMNLLHILTGTALLLLAHAASADPMGIVPPVGPGPYPVACSNVAQDFNRAATDDAREAYWEGSPAYYITGLLSEPQSAFLFTLPVPNDSSMYPNQQGRQIPYAAMVCYPTSADNTRADYPINAAGNRLVPKMQRGADRPLWADAAQRYPVLLYSHGLGASPLTEGYLETITRFASYGYVVAMPFHGDPRFANVHYGGLGDVARVFFGGGFAELVEMQAVRPLSLRAMLDTLLAHPDFRDHVDPSRIGGFGTSLGGETLLLFAGAELTTAAIPRLRSARVMQDKRLSAAVGYVPYFGQRLLPAFGDDEDGVNGMTMPFMAISGTADTTAPIDMTEQGVNHMAGSRYVVAIDGLPHQLRPADLPDIFTWSLTFFDAHLHGMPAARVKLARTNQVSGGAPDSLHIDYTAPSGSNLPLVAEYYNTTLKHYFVTSGAGEMADIEAGRAGPGWQKSGYSFTSAAGSGTPICRFYGNPAPNALGVRLGPNSHFYAMAGPECEQVKKDPGWVYEGLAFTAFESGSDGCAATHIPVYRVYNNDFAHNNSNHRYTTSRQVYRSMQQQGWVGEGTVLCTLP